MLETEPGQHQKQDWNGIGTVLKRGWNSIGVMRLGWHQKWDWDRTGTALEWNWNGAKNGTRTEPAPEQYQNSAENRNGMEL